MNIFWGVHCLEGTKITDGVFVVDNAFADFKVDGKIKICIDMQCTDQQMGM